MTTTLHTAIELAGMTDEEGLLGNPRFPVEGAQRPFRVLLEGDNLHYTFMHPKDLGSQPSDPVPNPKGQWPWDAPALEVKGMLDAFIRIGNETDILGFARRFGVLRICNHGLPASHYGREQFFTGVGSNWQSPCQLVPSRLLGGDWFVEPTAYWFHCVSQARSILTVASKVHRGESTTKADWVPLGMKWESLDGHHGLTVPNQLWILEMAVNSWLQIGGATPFFLWDAQGGTRFALAGGTFAIMAIQLMLAVSQSQSLALCSGCGRPYLRKGKKAQGRRRNFCPPCQQGPLPARLRKRDHDKKNRKVKDDRDG